MAEHYAIRTRDGRWVATQEHTGAWSMCARYRATFPAPSEARAAFDKVFPPPRDRGSWPVLVRVGHTPSERLADVQGNVARLQQAHDFLAAKLRDMTEQRDTARAELAVAQERAQFVTGAALDLETAQRERDDARRARGEACAERDAAQARVVVLTEELEAARRDGAAAAPTPPEAPGVGAPSCWEVAIGPDRATLTAADGHTVLALNGSTIATDVPVHRLVMVIHSLCHVVMDHHADEHSSCHDRASK